MIISKCPLRISLAGGSTDLQVYLDKYGKGTVITFTPNLYTYITLKPSCNNYYRIIYSSIDNCLHPDEIKNDIAREVIKYFNLPPVEIIFTSDIPSTGSGLASSSSYLISMINAALAFKNEELDTFELTKLALKIEHTFNPLTGYQDIYGCVFNGFKKLDFDQDGLSNIFQYNLNFFDNYVFHLVPTGITRSSTNMLNTLDIDKIHSLMISSNNMDKFLNEEDYDKVCKEINNGWELKKQTSPDMMNNKISNLENKLSTTTIARRLIGAGAGGYFLSITTPDQKLGHNSIPIKLGTSYKVIQF
jgi:D-glycero-alpha-D-manno-heptose-7-phosphate kinase